MIGDVIVQFSVPGVVVGKRITFASNDEPLAMLVARALALDPNFGHVLVLRESQRIDTILDLNQEVKP